MLGLLIYARQPVALASFYAAILAGSVSSDAASLLTVTFDGGAVFVHGIPAAYGGGEPGLNAPAAREDVALKPVLPVADLAEAEAIVLRLGGIWTARSHRAGSCDIVDPEGNVVQLVERAA
jgi:hypothetical protein